MLDIKFVHFNALSFIYLGILDSAVFYLRWIQIFNHPKLTNKQNLNLTSWDFIVTE